MINKLLLVGLLAVAAGCTRAEAPGNTPPPGVRIQSPLGFSLLPPPGEDWIEEFENSEIHFYKKTDPAVVSFFAGAQEVKLPRARGYKDELAKIVKAMKDKWGSDPRYTHVSTSFLPEAGQESCVRYEMRANDHAANNRGSHDFLLLRAVGRFCMHPKHPNVAVDMFYSVRHIPGFSPEAFTVEGDAFLNTLRFHEGQAGESAK